MKISNGIQKVTVLTMVLGFIALGGCSQEELDRAGDKTAATLQKAKDKFFGNQQSDSQRQQNYGSNDYASEAAGRPSDLDQYRRRQQQNPDSYAGGVQSGRLPRRYDCRYDGPVLKREMDKAYNNYMNARLNKEPRYNKYLEDYNHYKGKYYDFLQQCSGGR